MVFSLSSCVRSFTVGYLYVTGTITGSTSGNGIISGFKINNNNGKLTPMNGLPVSTGGANPGRAVLLTGGRFIYVLNQGLTASGSTVCTTADPCLNSNITEFVIGGNGILTPQETFFTQGINPFRLLGDASGNFILALDHDAPSGQYCGTVVSGATSCGDITVFSVNSSTGRLSLVTNAQLTSSTGTQVTYFPVPANPIDFTLASGYVMTLSGLPNAPNGQTVYPYTYNTSSGQLTVSQSVPQVITNGSGSAMEAGTAIIYAGGRIYILDNEPVTATSTGVISPSQILPYTIGTNGALQSQVGGAVPDDPNEQSPFYMIIESKNKFAYVLNQQGTSGGTTGAGLAQFTIDPSSSTLTESSGSPYGVGANPQCLLEDPSNQYLYTANQGDSTVTGKLLDPNSGELRPLQGSSGTFALNGPAAWCIATGRTN
jgi:6-phosphogluconolactonase (cycloisomerase 2 family)